MKLISIASHSRLQHSIETLTCMSTQMPFQQGRPVKIFPARLTRQVSLKLRGIQQTRFPLGTATAQIQWHILHYAARCLFNK